MSKASRAHRLLQPPPPMPHTCPSLESSSRPLSSVPSSSTFCPRHRAMLGQVTPETGSGTRAAQAVGPARTASREHGECLSHVSLSQLMF